jgi:hypothetical protein
MSKKNEMASALTGILSAKRGGDVAAAPTLSIATQDEPIAAPPPSPALLPSSGAMRLRKAETPVVEGPAGKRSDPNYSQYSLYLRKTTRKMVNRALDDIEPEQDFSELVETLLQQWLASRT